MDPTLPANTRESEELSKELEKARKEFLELFTRHKEMVDEEAVVLASLYYQKLGQFRYALLTKQTEASRLKMKMHLIQAAINRDEIPDLVGIEQELNSKLEHYYAEIVAEAANIEMAQKVLASLIPVEEAAKLKELFRLLCKKLHPDLNPNQSEEKSDLFIRVKAAYDLQDLAELQKILLYLNEEVKGSAVQVAGEVIRQRILHLKEQITSLKFKISQLDHSFPFDVKQLMEDEQAIRQKREEWSQLQLQAELEIAKCLQIIQIMVNE